MHSHTSPSQLAPDPLLFLTTLGTLRLDRDGAPVTGAAAQRLRLALLAVLAASPRGVSRDTLAGLLWGERNEERARHSLEQALYGLKSSLGVDPVRRTSTALVLDATVLRTDVAEFDAAIGAEDWERAAKAYSGAFLEGVLLSDAPEFEHWAERQRARRRDAFHRALEQCATAASARRAHDEAVHWWRRLHQETSFSTRSTIGLLRALDAAGDREEALSVAETHAAELARAARSTPELADLLGKLRGTSTQSGGESARGEEFASKPVSASVSADLSQALGDAYRIEGRIARSRIYDAFRARHVQSGRLSIVKVLDPAIVRYGDRRTLLQQLERAAALSHEYLAGFSLVGTLRHLVYLLGPDDEGETLLERVRQRGELAVTDALTLAHQVGSALSHAHAAGVLHLDLTPKRVLMRQRSALLRDTGIVSAIRGAVATGGPKSDETDVVLGTPAFMSPEFMRAQGLPNERSDLFSFAAVLHFGLTGAPPFGTTGAGAQARPVAPSTAAIRPSVPAALDAALSRALSPLRSDRQVSVSDFLKELPAS